MRSAINLDDDEAVSINIIYFLGDVSAMCSGISDRNRHFKTMLHASLSQTQAICEVFLEEVSSRQFDTQCNLRLADSSGEQQAVLTPA